MSHDIDTAAPWNESVEQEAHRLQIEANVVTASPVPEDPWRAALGWAILGNRDGYLVHALQSAIRHRRAYDAITTIVGTPEDGETLAGQVAEAIAAADDRGYHRGASHECALHHAASTSGIAADPANPQPGVWLPAGMTPTVDGVWWRDGARYPGVIRNGRPMPGDAYAGLDAEWPTDGRYCYIGPIPGEPPAEPAEPGVWMDAEEARRRWRPGVWAWTDGIDTAVDIHDAEPPSHIHGTERYQFVAPVPEAP